MSREDTNNFTKTTNILQEIYMAGRFELVECNDDDVLSFGEETFKVGKLRKAISKFFNCDIGENLNDNLSYEGVRINKKIIMTNNDRSEYQRWFSNGIDCEILNLGSKSWKKGKVGIKINVEFYIEEEDYAENNSERPQSSQLESPLDELRRVINQGNQ